MNYLRLLEHACVWVLDHTLSLCTNSTKEDSRRAMTTISNLNSEHVPEPATHTVLRGVRGVYTKHSYISYNNNTCTGCLQHLFCIIQKPTQLRVLLS